MIWIVLFIAIWDFLAICVIASRTRKLNRHHHGGFTQGRVVQYHEE